MRLTRFTRSTNPVFNSLGRDDFYASENSATYGGIVFKTLFLFLIAITSGYFVIGRFEFIYNNIWLYFFAMIGAFVSVILARNPQRAVIFAPLYAVFEGVILGATVGIVNAFAPGIAQTAVLVTLSVFLVMLVLYSTGLVRVGPIFRRVVMGAFFGLFFFMLISMVIGLFAGGITTLFSDKTILLISLISAGIASLMILLDLDNCTRLVKSGAPKEYEWSASLGLMVTIIWLFIEILRILLIFASRQD